MPGIKNSYARDTYISRICAMDTWIEYTNIESICIREFCLGSVFVGGVKPKALVRLGIILESPDIIFKDIDINDWYFWLFIRLVFTLIDGMSY